MFRPQRFDFVVCLLLALATVLAYGDLFSHQFVNIDDTIYVTQNPFVQSGLNGKGFIWAFTTARAEFWHPLTWLSYMLDTTLFGSQAAGYLFTNLLLHVLNTVLVYLVFTRMTGNRWSSAFMAALFALHPLHVESVAWIAERKDVLSAVFWMLTTYAYIYYIKRPGRMVYLLICLFLTLGLMTKPMLVTLPCVLLLLDYWPLGRWKPEGSLPISIRSAIPLIREKIPLFLIAVIFSLVAYLVQKSSGGISSTEQYTLVDRVLNALISYASYMGKMLWPHKLAVFYPFPANLSIWKIGAAAFLLFGITLLALKLALRWPFIIVGWLWYLGTLIPVIGLIKIGDFSMADRYMYIPLIGLSMIIAWGLPIMLARIPAKRTILATTAVIALVGLSFATFGQVRTWTNSFTLFEHALEVTKDNFFAHYGLGHAYAHQGKFDAAGVHFSKAVQLNPSKATLYNDWGRCLVAQDKFDDAEVQFSAALQIAPQHPATHFYLANIGVIRKRFDQAVYHFSEVLRLDPDFPGNGDGAQRSEVLDYQELLSLYDTNDKISRAIEQIHKIVSTDSQNLAALRKLVVLYAIKGDHERALALLHVELSTRTRKRDIIRGYASWRPPGFKG